MAATLRVFQVGKEYGLLLTVGVQTFEINRPADTPAHAFWMARQLEVALVRAGATVEIQKEIQYERFG